MNDEKRTVRVTIFGEEYAIRSDMGEKYTLACARHVDDAIHEAHLRGKVAEPHKAAILAAMQITDELFRRRAAQTHQARGVTERIGALRERIGRALDRTE